MSNHGQSNGSHRLGTVIVTGGSSGLGAACVEGIRARSGRPVVLDHIAPPGDVEHVIVDLADTEAAEAAVRNVAERHPDFEAVVAAAGTDSCGKLTDVSRDAWEKVIRVNLLAVAAVVRAALPYLEACRGRIVTVASTLGVKAVSDATAYCASKFGLVGFTRALAAETAGRVGVTLLIPGGMATAFFDGREARYKPPSDARLNSPEHVAQSVLFALEQPGGCEVRELVVCPSTESSWP